MRMPQSPFLCLFLLTLALGAHADPVVVNVRANIGAISKQDVINIFLGPYRGLPNGELAQPINQHESNAIRDDFYRLLVNKRAHEIKAYWSRLMFSGKIKPPIETESSQEVVALLLKSNRAIGYVDRKEVDNRLRVVLELGP